MELGGGKREREGGEEGDGDGAKAARTVRRAPWWNAEVDALAKRLPEAAEGVGARGKLGEGRTWVPVNRQGARGGGVEVCVDTRVLKGYCIGKVAEKDPSKRLSATQADLRFEKAAQKEIKSAKASKSSGKRVEGNATYARKVRLRPDKKQRESLLRTFLLARKYYNKLVELTRLEDTEKYSISNILGRHRIAKKIEKVSLESALAALVVKSDSLLTTQKPKYLELYSDIRNDIMKEFVKSRRTAIESKKRFKMKSKRADAPSNSIMYRPRWMVQHGNLWKPCPFVKKANGFGPDFSSPIFTGNRLWNKPEHDMRLQLDRLGRFWLCVIKTKKVPATETHTRTKPVRIVAMDPGGTCFQTAYSPSTGEILRVGDRGMGSKIFPIALRVDEIKAKMAPANLTKEIAFGKKVKTKRTEKYDHKSPVQMPLNRVPYVDAKKARKRKRWRMRRAILRLNLRVRNLVNDAQKHLASHLCNNFDVIVLPKFESSKKVRKPVAGTATPPRRINKTTARQLLTWAHYRFLMWMRHKVHMTGKTLIECGEPYTSQACGRCGVLNEGLGANKTFECIDKVGCGYKADRDGNAARNILLRVSPSISLSFAG